MKDMCMGSAENIWHMLTSTEPSTCLSWLTQHGGGGHELIKGR